MAPARPTIAQLVIGDDPVTWEGLGFSVGTDGGCQVGATLIRLAGTSAGEGILGWSLRGAAASEIDGLPSVSPPVTEAPRTDHPNGALSIDHVVVTTPDLPRTFAALEAAGLELRRVREAGTADRPLNQGFFRLGEVILEVVGPPAPVPGDDGPARFWGMVCVVADLEACAALLRDRLGRIKDAVQPGRRIATVRREAGASVPLALITPRP
jgi:hypothetical protein